MNMHEKVKIKIVKKSNGCEELYIDGVKLREVVSYSVGKELMSCNYINIQLAGVDVEIVKDNTNLFKEVKPMEQKLPKIRIEEYTGEQGWIIKREIYVDGVLIPSENIEFKRDGITH